MTNRIRLAGTFGILIAMICGIWLIQRSGHKYDKWETTAGAVKAVHLKLKWSDSSEPTPDHIDSIHELERHGYHFKGSYEVKGSTYLVYEKD